MDGALTTTSLSVNALSTKIGPAFDEYSLTPFKSYMTSLRQTSMTLQLSAASSKSQGFMAITAKK